MQFDYDPGEVNPDAPLVYLWVLDFPSGRQERYVGKAKGGAKRPLTHYRRNIENLRAGNRASSPTGIPHVLVSGTFVVRDGESQIGARPGQPIRYELITDGDIVLDYDDKQYQWHAEIPDHEDTRRD